MRITSDKRIRKFSIHGLHELRDGVIEKLHYYGIKLLSDWKGNENSFPECVQTDSDIVGLPYRMFLKSGAN